MKVGNPDTSNFFSPDFASNVRLIFFLLLAFVLMFFDVRSDKLVPVKKILADVTQPIVIAVNAPMLLSDGVSGFFQDKTALEAQVERLERENFIMRTKTQRLASLEAENNRLRALMQSSSSIVQNVVIAEIIAVNFDPYRHQVTLNRGQSDGVYSGQSLIADQGIVGQVEKSYRNYSIAVLITDPSHTIPVQVNRNGLRALLNGRGQFRALDVGTVPNYEDIQIGDQLVTSGLGGRFPRGYPVAQVTDVTFNPATPFAQVSAQPNVELDRLREVLLVVDEQDAQLGSSPIGPFKTP